MRSPQSCQSVEDQLRTIDQALIRLLKQRVTLMQQCTCDGQLPSLRKQMHTRHSLLREADLPEQLWATLLTECAAATIDSTKALTESSRSKRKVTLVGGNGVMGRFFSERLRIAGHHVNVLERDNWADAGALLADCDLVLLCVPLHLTASIAQQVSAYLSPHTALADIASVKAPIMRTMLKVHSGPVMGLHPMFGPGVHSFKAQKVVVCSGRDDASFQWLLDIIQQEGGELVSASPEEHDQMMVTVQAVRHFATLCLGIFLAREQVDIHQSLRFSSPLYRMQISLIGRLFAQDTSLCTDIIMASDESCQTIQRLASTFCETAELFLTQDRETLSHEMKVTHQFFEKSSGQAFYESNYLIKRLTSLLIATNLELQSPDCFTIRERSNDDCEQAA